jgi:predicted transcriptional regulator
MKVRKVQVAIKSEEQFWQDFKSRVAKFAQAAQKGKAMRRRPDSLVFDSLAEMARVLTPRRLELLGFIRRHHPESVRELAALSHRDIKNVSADVRALEQYGLIEVDQDRGPRKRKRLAADYERLDVQVYL